MNKILEKILNPNVLLVTPIGMAMFVFVKVGGVNFLV